MAALGRVDILVNNAGTSRTGAFADITDAVWQEDFDLKVFAAIRLTRLVWPQMMEQSWGRVINVPNIGAKAPGRERADIGDVRGRDSLDQGAGGRGRPSQRAGQRHAGGTDRERPVAPTPPAGRSRIC